MKKLPESAIPMFHEPETFKKWHEGKTQGKSFYGKTDFTREAWVYTGDRSLESEFNEFTLPLLAHSEDVLKRNNGAIKIVSFGGGMLRGLLELRKMLEHKAKELGLEPKIQLEDYSLTKKLGLVGIEDANAESLLLDKTLRLHIGPIELRDLKDASNADVMVSAYGPFYHAHDKQQLTEIVVKAVRNLAPGGRAFLDGAFYGHPTLDAKILDGVRAQLGPEYLVSREGGTEHGGGYFDIQRQERV